MSANIIVDTSELVSADDRTAADQQRTAIAVLASLVRRRMGVVSKQVLSEFFVAVTREIAQLRSVAYARRRIEVYLQTWIVLDLTGMIVLE